MTTMQARPLAPVGNRNAAENNHNNSNNCFRYETPAQGNSADYLTARIARDRPEIAAARAKERQIRKPADSIYHVTIVI